MRGDEKVRGSGRGKRQAVSGRKEPMRSHPNRISRGQSAPRPSISVRLLQRETPTLEPLEPHRLGSNNALYESTFASTQSRALALLRAAVAVCAFRFTRCGLVTPHNTALGSPRSTAFPPMFNVGALALLPNTLILIARRTSQRTDCIIVPP